LVERTTSIEATTTSKNMLGVLVLKLSQVASAILFAALIPRTMGATSYGKFAFLISIVTIALSVVNLAIGSTFGRFFPEFESHGERNLVNKLFINMLSLKTIFTVVLCSFLLVALMFLYGSHYPTSYFILVVLIVLLTDWESVFFAVLFGFNKLILFAIREPLRRLLSVLLILILFQAFGILGAILASCLVSVVMLFIGILFAKDYIKFSKESISLGFLKPYLMFGIAVSISWVLINVWRTVGNILIDTLTNDSKAVAFFDITQRIFQVSSSITIMLINSLVPMFTTLLITNKSQKIVDWSKRITRYTCILNVIGVGIFIVFGLDIIPYVIGKEYRAVYPVAVVMLLCIFPLVLVQTGSLLSIVYKEQVQYLKLLTISVLSFAIAAILLIPKYSEMGCAIASVISYCLMAALVVYKFQDKMLPCLTQVFKILILGTFLSPILLLKGDWLLKFGVTLSFTGSFLLILFATKQISFQEVEEVITSLRSKN
jgi:O-antigen/teichoic acid export membrane protein